jgi:hypothetical protein
MEKKKTYSKFQYFFWLISGSEISSLKDCPEDYNRHANIGMMILITSIFAFGTAFIAGMTFANSNPFGVFLFAIMWGILIFALDRSMVNSIKRDPEATVQPFWSYFIPRFILAFILAFFMSVPLDHIVFPEAIERQMKINVHDDWLKRQNELNQGYNVADQEKDVAKMESDLAKIDSTLKSDCPLPEYKQAQNDYNNSLPKIPPLKTSYDNKVKERKEYYHQLQIKADSINPPIDGTWLALNEDCKNANASFKSQQAETETYKQEAKRIEKEWRENLQKKYDSKDSLHTASDAKLKVDKDSVETNASDFKKDLQDMTGFDTKFTTLFLMPNWGVQILKWAIFLALLVIEILPTYLKLRTPIGEYDVEISKKERAHSSRARHFVTKEDEIAEESERYRKEKELKLNKAVVDKIAEIELRLANESLDDWEKEAMTQIKTNGADPTNGSPKL